ncbi:hypothetical protein Tco_0565813 [Tanacetum coccineum]
MQQEDDGHVTLTTVHDKTEGTMQSYSVSSDFTSKLLNLDNTSPNVNEIASLMNTSTVPPSPPLINPSLYLTTISQQQTPDSTTTTTNPTMTLPEIPNFDSLFHFDQREPALETKMSEFNQTSQFFEVVSSISGIIDQYLASKIKEVVDVAVRLQSNKLKEEAKAENQEVFNQVDFTMKAIINEQNLYNTLVESYNSDKDILTSYGDVVTLKRGRDDQDKDEDPFAGSDRGTKRRKSSKDVEPSKGSKSSSSFKGTQSQPKSSGKSTQAEEPEFEAADTEKSNKPPTPDRAWNKSKSIDFRPPHKWISTIAKERQPPCTFDELMRTPIDFSAYVMNRLKIENLTKEILVGQGREYPFDLSKPLPLIKDRGRQLVPADYFINHDLEYLKGIEDMVPTLWSPVKVAYDKHAVWGTIIAVTSVKVMRWYDYGYLEEIVVRRDDNVLYKFKEGDFPRLNLCDIIDMLLLLVQKKLLNHDVDDRLMRSDELYKFCDGTLSSVRRVLHDIASNLEMDYLPKRHWCNLEMKRSRIMVKAIDKLLFERSQNWRDLPRDIPLDSVVVLRYEKRSKSENKGRVPTEMELVLEQTQQGTSYEVSVSAEGVEELKRKVKIKGEKKEALLTLRQKPEHRSDTKVIHNDDGNPSRANIKQALERFNTTAGNPVNEILLKLNLPDHMSILIDSKEYVKMDMENSGNSYGGESGGDMVVSGGLKECLDHWIQESSPLFPPP